MYFKNLIKSDYMEVELIRIHFLSELYAKLSLLRQRKECP